MRATVEGFCEMYGLEDGAITENSLRQCGGEKAVRERLAVGAASGRLEAAVAAIQEEAAAADKARGELISG